MRVLRYPTALACVAALSLLSACSGLLFIDARSLNEKPCETFSDCNVGQICADGVCQDVEPCTPDTPTGEYCPEGLACVDGVCTDGGEVGWCDCPCNQGCQGGACVDVTQDNECSGSNPDGPCLCGDVCVAGTCLPIDPACTPETPTGLCPSGASCVNGYCVPTDDDRCGPGNSDGLCPAGQECRDPGPACYPITCTPACSTNQACSSGTCIDIPCSPNNPDGACDALDPDGDGTADLPTACSHSGECIACPSLLTGLCCDHPQDCAGNQFCSVGLVDDTMTPGCTGPACAHICLNNNTCLVDEDCGDFYVCNGGTCERDLDCTGDSDCCPDAATSGCTVAEFCSETAPRTCIEQGTCIQDVDCRSASRICATSDVCLDVGKCIEDADCRDAALECSAGGDCIEVGTCSTASDCPPSHVCNGSNECVPDTNNGDPCTTNDFVAPGTVLPNDCDPAALRCCSTGTEEDCCPQGERCSMFGDCTADPYNCLCIPNGECVNDDDCLGGQAGGYFRCIDYQCVPQQADCVGACVPQQTGCAECSGTDVCSYAGGCIPDEPPETCADDRDCLAGEACNANFECETAGNCGAATFNTTLVKPNVLVVLDRSGSMQVCAGQYTKGCCGGCPIPPTEDQRICWDFDQDNNPVVPGCSGSEFYCNEHTSAGEQTCSDELACEWSGGQCIDFDNVGACGDIADRTTCDSDVRCSWSSDEGGVCLDSGRNARWLQARTAIDDLTYAHNVLKDDMRFGLSVYPRRCGTAGVCAYDARCTSQADQSSCESIVGCIWTGSECDVTYNPACETRQTQPDCESLSSCSWDISTQECLAPCPGHDPCLYECNWCSCSGNTCPGNVYEPGIVDVAVGSGTRDTINSYLEVTFPGGGTPTGPTLRNVLDDSAAAGLAASDRENVVVLITDGEANAAPGSVSEPGCGSNDYTCEVNHILADLVDLPNATTPAPSIKTYVIGFAFGSVSHNLNCHATHGGASRCATPAECSAIATDVDCDATHGCTWSGSCTGGVDAGNCDSAAPDCYYSADDADSLATALDDIIGSIATCSFILDPAPPDPQKLYVELDYGTNDLPGTPPGADCTTVTAEDNCRLDSGSTTWDYDDATQQIEFYGAWCDDVQGGFASPQVIYGCPGGEG